MSIELGGETIPPGEARWISVKVARDADRSPIALECYVVNGVEDGPVLLFQGGIHGNEPVGGLAIRDFALDIKPSMLSGAIVALPVANPSAFRNKQRRSQVVHVGDADVNSNFPGSPDGPFPQQLAHELFSLAEERADVVVDAHSADEQVVMHTGFVYVPATEDEAHRRARKMASSTGMPHVVELPPEEIDGFYVAELARVGIPAIMVETGGGATVFDWAYERYMDSFYNVSYQVGALSGDTPTADQTFHDDLTFVFSREGGYVEIAVQGGDTVESGDRLGEITDLRGTTVETFEAPCDADILAIRSFPSACPGDMIVELAPI